MIKLFKNNKGNLVLAKIKEDKKSEYGYRYFFWKTNPKNNKLIPATKSYVTKVLNSLLRPYDRMDLWICMRSNGWVGEENEKQRQGIS